MLSQRDLDIMWLEAMEEIDEVEAEFMETLRGKDASTQTSRSSETETRSGSSTQESVGGEGFGGAPDYS